jgi:hypothetical protein
MAIAMAADSLSIRAFSAWSWFTVSSSFSGDFARNLPRARSRCVRAGTGAGGSGVNSGALPAGLSGVLTGVLIATFRCYAPARCGAFADERRIVAGRRGRPSADAVQQYRVHLPHRHFSLVGRQIIEECARP